MLDGNAGNGHDCINKDDKTDSARSLSPLNDDFDGKSESIYGSIRPITSNCEDFTYKTMNGGIIRSVHPPGKGNSASYKVRALIVAAWAFMCLLTR